MIAEKIDNKKFTNWLYKNDKLVQLKNGYVFIKTHTDYKYSFSIDRIDTPIRLTWWLHHLCEKRWMDNERVRRLIEVAAENMGIKMYEGEK